MLITFRSLGGSLQPALLTTLLAICNSSSGQQPPAPVHAYVPNQRSGTLSVIDTQNDRVVRTLSASGQIGKRLQQLTLHAGKVYAIDAEKQRLVEIDKVADKLLRSVDIGVNAEGVTVSPNGRQFAICVEGQNKVMLIDAAQLSVTAQIALQGQAPEHCAYTPDSRFVLTSNEGSDDLDVIDVAAAKSIATIKTSGHPRGIGFLPDGNTVYVAQESANVVDVIDLAARRKLASIPTGLRTAGIAVSRDGKRVYATNGGAGTVSVIDTDARKVIAEIAVGERPWNPALTPDGRKLYVANGRSNTVSVIDTQTLKPISQVPVGDMPWGVVIAQHQD